MAPWPTTACSSRTRCSAGHEPSPASTTSATAASRSRSACSSQAMRGHGAASRPSAVLIGAHPTRPAAEEPAAAHRPAARHPEIHEIEVTAPIIIAGLPRTGTTHLHNLLAADPALRYLPYWESIEPIPRPATVGIEPDPRCERTEQAAVVHGPGHAPVPADARDHPLGTRTRRSICWPSTSRRCSSRRWPTCRDWTGLLPRARPDPALPLHAHRAAGAAVPARAITLGAEVAAAHRAVRTAGRGVPRRRRSW